MLFMHPGSTTMPKSRTSSCTRTFEEQTAVQCPHPSQLSFTLILPTETMSAGPKNPPYGHAYVQNPLLPRKYTTPNEQMKMKGMAMYHGAKVFQKSSTTMW